MKKLTQLSSYLLLIAALGSTMLLASCSADQPETTSEATAPAETVPEISEADRPHHPQHQEPLFHAGGQEHRTHGLGERLPGISV